MSPGDGIRRVTEGGLEDIWQKNVQFLTTIRRQWDILLFPKYNHKQVCRTLALKIFQIKTNLGHSQNTYQRWWEWRQRSTIGDVGSAAAWPPFDQNNSPPPLCDIHGLEMVLRNPPWLTNGLRNPPWLATLSLDLETQEDEAVKPAWIAR